MARRTSADSSRGFDDIIGVVLLVFALLLLVSQWSFNWHDIGWLAKPASKPAHNWIGPLGAYLAWTGFLFFGIAGYVLPALCAIFGGAYLVGLLPYLRERLRWSLGWSLALLLAVTGLLHLADTGGWLRGWRESIGSQSAGGWLGYVTYGDSPHYQWGFSLLGPVGATIIYIALCLISLLFLTD